MATGAILIAVITVLNYIASLHLIRLDLVFYLIAGAGLYFAAMRYGIRFGAVCYIASAALSLILVPEKVWLLFFVGAFGPAAIIQAIFAKRSAVTGATHNKNAESRAGRKRTNRMQTALTLVIFAALFYGFGLLIGAIGGFSEAFGGLAGDEGRLSLFGQLLPEMTTSLFMVLMLVVAVISAFVSYAVNAGIYDLLRRRLDGAADGMQRNTAAGKPGKIVLPKMYDDGFDESD